MDFGRLISSAVSSPHEIPSHGDISLIVGYCDMKAHETFGPRSTTLSRQLMLREDPPYPETFADSTTVLIVLTSNRSWLGYFYEAAHEVVHALDATAVTSGTGTWLEEGIATAFSMHIVREVFGRKLARNASVGSSYRRAHRLVSEVDRDVLRLGQQLRAQAGSIPAVSSKDILSLYPKVPKSRLSDLLQRFKHRDR